METKCDEQQALSPEKGTTLSKIANSIRQLSMDAVQKANSGHPGLPMGCAELGAYLYGHFLKHNPKNPEWINRDRFILSAGHGSMLLYSCLHLAGFDLSKEDLKQFRQLHSKTPGHPENFITDGVETTTGPLGQGFANAVGQALAFKILADKFNTSKHKIFDNKIVVLAGDGDFMEGICAEASSLAGHLQIDNLIVYYDYNQISLDGPLSECCSENTKQRYLAYGWEVFEVDGHNIDALHLISDEARKVKGKPVLILSHTKIGKGSPNKEGSCKAHGAPLGEEEVLLSKKALNLPEEAFYVPKSVTQYFEEKVLDDQKREETWQNTFKEWSEENSALFEEFEKMRNKTRGPDFFESLYKVNIPSSNAGRKSSHSILQVLGKELPDIYGGSADLSCSDMTMMEGLGVIAPGNFNGRNIKFGVREFAMAAMCVGMVQSKMITPYCGTFLTFSDYMRNAIRLAALMKEQVIFQFTHDSIFLGEDGPTHQPIEHLASLRAMPNLLVLRPADNREVVGSWIAALQHKGPSALIFTRQNLPLIEGTEKAYHESVGRGAYIVKKEKDKADYSLFASGSELSLAMDLAQELERIGKDVRVISMPSWELFEKQSEAYQETVLGGDIGKRVSIEAGSDQGWHKWIGRDGIAIAMESFGASAPAGMLAKEFGFTVESILERIL